MPPRQEVERLRASNEAVNTLIRRDLQGFWGSLDLNKPENTRDALLVVVPELVKKYGKVAATVAADYYDTQRAAARVRKPYRAIAADPVADEASIGSVRRTAGYLFTDTPGAMLTALLPILGRYAMQPGRSTIALNANREHVRWARVPGGGRTCAFCLVMASRGFSYGSESAAGNDYHNDCGCVPTPDWSDEPHLEGYDPRSLYQSYASARDEAGDDSLKGSGSAEDGDLSILQVLRRQEGIN